mmetsp:Transcript_11571/g.27486  ORF Transcript_11571/g.27486 Transcript_11571/m.27486 type:complete len:520 (-) Transcript_11571:1224-2783(-)
MSGHQVGLGYLNRPQFTAERFVRHGVLGLCFRTGDIARAGPRGWELVGRKDAQVKISGQRIELGEIEEAVLLAASSGPGGLIEAAAVVASGAPQGGGLRLVAWCVPSRPEECGLGSSPAGAAGEAEREPEAASSRAMEGLLRILTRRVLPRHMVPSRFVFARALPTSPNGKVDRGALRRRPLPELDAGWEADGGGGGAPLGGPHADWRRLVAEAWEEELGVPSPLLASPGADWFALGGDSLGALRCCRRIAERAPSARGCGGSAGAFGELLGPLAPAEMLQRPRLSEFARHLGSSLGALCGEEPSPPEGPPGASSPDGEGSELTALAYEAAAAGASSVLRFLLLAEGLDPSGRSRNNSDKSFTTLLHVAVSHGREHAVSELLSLGASPHTADRAGVLPVHLAAQKGPTGILKMILSAGANIYARDDSSQSVLHHAARANAPVKVWNILFEKWLSATGTEVKTSGKHRSKSKLRPPTTADVLDQWGRTPLHWAVVNGHGKAVELLLEAGSNTKVFVFLRN